MWTVTTELDEYVSFLRALFLRVTTWIDGARRLKRLPAVVPFHEVSEREREPV